MPIDIAAVRAELPSLDECLYFNTAAEGPIPRRALEAALWALDRKTNPARFRLQDYFEFPKRARRAAARLLAVDESAVSFIPSTSYGVNVAANGLPLRDGDEVLTLRGQFPANVHPWLNLRRKGIAVRFMDAPADEVRLEHILPHLTPRTRVLALDWVQFCTGARADLAEIVPALRLRGIWSVVDATQGLGALELREHHPDVLLASGHKWLLSMVGTGLMYVAPHMRGVLQPPFMGWMSHLASEDFGNLTDYENSPLAADGRAYEVGSPIMDHLTAFATSLEWLCELGPAEIEARIHALEAPLLEWLRGHGLEVDGAREASRRSAIAGFRAPGRDMDALYRGLLREGVICAMREGRLRLSPHFFTMEAEVGRLIEILEKLTR